MLTWSSANLFLIYKSYILPSQWVFLQKKVVQSTLPYTSFKFMILTKFYLNYNKFLLNFFLIIKIIKLISFKNLKTLAFSTNTLKTHTIVFNWSNWTSTFFLWKFLSPSIINSYAIYSARTVILLLLLKQLNYRWLIFFNADFFSKLIYHSFLFTFKTIAQFLELNLLEV